MASTIGPRFALRLSQPPEWNSPEGIAGESVTCAVRTSGGEGYLIEIADLSLRQSLARGEERWVFIAQILRDDAEILYGFESIQERSLFLELCQLDSVGPKTAGLILASVSRQDLLLMVHGQTPGLVKIPGVGSKTLEKMKVGLKVGKDKFLKVLGQVPAAGLMPSARPATAPSSPYPALVDTLERLGMRPVETLRLCQELEAESPDFPSLVVGDQVKLLLQKLGRQSPRALATERT